MTATPKLLTSCVALTVTLLAWSAYADTSLPGVRVAQSREQTGSAASDRHRSEELLKRAKRAMKEGKYELADSYIERAQRLDVKYDSLFRSFQYTPSKARKELAKLRKRAENPTGRSGSRFLPSLLSKPRDDGKSPSPDPFQARRAESPIRVPSVEPERAPVVRTPIDRDSPFGPSPREENATARDRGPGQMTYNRFAAEPSRDRFAERDATVSSSKRTESLKLLAEAQIALDGGDVDRAYRLALAAKNLNVPDAE